MSSFRSILFEGDGPLVARPPIENEVLHDLNLDQIVAGALQGRDRDFLRSIYLTPVPDAPTVRYRQQISTDLQKADVRAAVAQFGERMGTVRALVGPKERVHRYERLRWMVDGAHRYGRAVVDLADALGRCDLSSRGLVGFRKHLVAHAESTRFQSLLAEARSCTDGLNSVRYNVQLHDLKVTVLPYCDEADYGTEIEQTFARFQQGAVKKREFTFPAAYMTRVDEQIVDRVALLNPEVFGELERFGQRHAGFVDETIGRFGREVGFYLAYLDLIEPLRAAGLAFCYPQVGEGPVETRDGVDLALALKLAADGRKPVPNDFELHGPERVLVVTGPNQGGKTTFARMFGQLHYLASLGLPVPASAARLRLFDNLATHFDRQERAEDLTGKLEDDLLRMHRITESATRRSIVILNESLSSTTADDALKISREVLGALIERGATCVCVTFLDELSRLGEATVSMVAEVDPKDLTRRTHRILRRPADGLAYAQALAEKYGVTYRAIRQRVPA